MKRIIEILEDEYWFGGVVDEGIHQPFTRNSCYSINLEKHDFVNQIQTVFLSTKGRVIGAKQGFSLFVRGNDLVIEAASREMKLQLLSSPLATLKGAYLLAAETYFPFAALTPPLEFFTKPQFNTWIELIYNQNQQGILDYAEQILAQGYDSGILMIDDGWSDYYGKWIFNEEKFSNPKEMIRTLHTMGFKIMLWVCPFITPDTVIYRKLKKQSLLVKDKEGEIAIREWWNGHSAVLDMSNPETVAWLSGQFDYLMNEFGVDGFKFDAGDAAFYLDTDRTYGNVSANEQSRLWAEYGLNYTYNEYRACFNNGGEPLVQRLADKDHSWDKRGMQALIPNQLMQGLLGYPYSCPDMIGGGEYENFLSNSKQLDEELFVRYAQVSALMPMMQFSAAPWRVLSEQYASNCLKTAQLRKKFAPYLEELIEHTKTTGEPITRWMCYEFPEEGMEQVSQQFMLGSDYLVAPVVEKGQVERTVVLPEGKWTLQDGTIYTGGQTVKIACPISELIYLKKENSE